MMRSLFSGVSGLKAHQTKMDVIGNNIANVNTIAYKAQSVTFSDVFYQTTQAASGPNAATGTGGKNAMQIGLGSNVGSIATNNTEGATQRTDNPFDLRISGSAFFVVSSNGNTYFTRAGNFKDDESGALVTDSGASVMGWQADANGNIVQDIAQPLYVKGKEFTYTDPAVTQGVTVSGNINVSDKKLTDGDGKLPYTFNFYDSLGNSYQATAYLSKDTAASNDAQTVYNMELGAVTMGKELTNLSGTFTPATISFDAVTGELLTESANVGLQFGTTANDYNQNSKVQVNTNTLNQVGGNAQISLDMSGLTQYAAETDMKASLGTKNADGEVVLDGGKAVGVMSQVGIDGSGFIVANYTNGDVKKIGQIAVTTFENPGGLEKVGSNMYAATLNSGLFDGIGQDVTAADGGITSGVVEMSNVDLSSEFTEMITTQRGFQANSRIITVSDTMIEELVNLKR